MMMNCSRFWFISNHFVQLVLTFLVNFDSICFIWVTILGDFDPFSFILIIHLGTFD